MSVDYRLIGSRIRAQRKQLHKTQENLAEELGVTVGYISQLERGVTKINLDMLSRICNRMDCDISFLISGAVTERTEYLGQELPQQYNLLTAKQKQFLLDFIRLLLKSKDSLQN